VLAVIILAVFIFVKFNAIFSALIILVADEILFSKDIFTPKIKYIIFATLMMMVLLFSYYSI